jgi:hypothetical protein
MLERTRKTAASSNISSDDGKSKIRRTSIEGQTRVDTLPFLETVCCHPDFQLSVSKPSPYYTELSGRNNDTVKAFFNKVQKLYTMKDMGNPFMEETGDLFTLDTKIIAHPSVTEMVGGIQQDYHYLFLSPKGEELRKHEWIHFPFLRQFAVILIFNCQ